MCGLISRLGRSPGGGHGNPLIFLPGASPRTEETDGLQSMGSQRIGHNWVTKHKAHKKRKFKVIKYFPSKKKHSPSNGKISDLLLARSSFLKRCLTSGLPPQLFGTFFSSRIIWGGKINLSLSGIFFPTRSTNNIQYRFHTHSFVSPFPGHQKGHVHLCSLSGHFLGHFSISQAFKV